MNDQQLADRIYALVGLCGFDALEAGNNYEYVRDPRPALALMEKCSMTFVERLSPGKWACRADKEYGDRSREWCEHESLCRAINEACCEALLRHLIGVPVEHEFIYTVTGRVKSPQMCYREFMPHTVMDRWVLCHLVDGQVVLGPAKI